MGIQVNYGYLSRRSIGYYPTHHDHHPYKVLSGRHIRRPSGSALKPDDPLIVIGESER